MTSAGPELADRHGTTEIMAARAFMKPCASPTLPEKERRRHIVGAESSRCGQYDTNAKPLSVEPIDIHEPTSKFVHDARNDG